MSKKKHLAYATIVIRLNGDETTATLMGDEFRTAITRTIANRNPKDEYDAYIGARVALDRLFDKDASRVFDNPPPVKPSNPTPKWQVGDLVIATGCPIVPDLFGMEGTVTSVRGPDLCGHYAYSAKFGRQKIYQSWSDTRPNAVQQSPEKPKAAKFQVGDIVRVTNAGITFGRYKNGDVAVVTEVNTHPVEFAQPTYRIKVRSKERKGSEGVAFAEELTLLHRPAKEGEKR